MMVKGAGDKMIIEDDRAVADVLLAPLAEFLKYCETAGAVNIEAIRRAATRRDQLQGSRLARLQQKWYSSLASGSIDYSVYDAEVYLVELWICWTRYSRKYITQLRKSKAIDGRTIFSDIGNVRSAVDLGCGIGFTTAAIKQTFPNARVIGTTFGESIQTRVAREVGRRYDFGVVEKLPDLLGEVDMVFASEYFEHAQEPVKHLREVVCKAAPRAIIIANSFNTAAIGHFTTYLHDGRLIPQEAISRIFNAALRDAGYEKVKTKLWNQRPAYWRRRS